jgi:Trk K+ transport system NAD-binding subunit
MFYFYQSRSVQRNIWALFKFLVGITLAIITYSVVFHYIMEYEGREYSWVTGFYWTLTVMSTLGFGDITFTSDLGRIFSMWVLLSGIFFLLVMLPFTFIQFFYAPWLENQAQIRTPRQLPSDTSGHVILTNYDAISTSLIEKLRQYHYNYVIVVPDQQKALEFFDQHYKVVIGELDSAETYRHLRVENAALVFVNNDDMLNTSIVSTIRELSGKVPIVTNADIDYSLDILKLAGASHVFQFTKMLGTALARRAIGVSAHANIIGRFDQLLIAEASAMRTPFEGKSLIESKLRETTGVNVIGIWQRGSFEIPDSRTRIHSTSVLVLAGSEEHFRKFDETVGDTRTSASPVLILGGGRVGRSAARALAERGIDYRIVEKSRHLIKDDKKYIIGSAADINTLEQAGISDAPTVFVTTHNDDINTYLTIYCRKLRPDIQIISRANRDGSIGKLHSAGADLVMSYASMGANNIINILKPNKILMLAEGLNVFRVPVPAPLVEKSIAGTGLREKTGCNIVAIYSGEKININPAPSVRLQRNDELIMIGTSEAEESYIKSFSVKT